MRSPPPGHTGEHLAFELLDATTPLGVFTGGSLIVGGAARTDLAIGPHLPAARAGPDPQPIEVPTRHTVEQLGQPNESLARLDARVVQQVPAGGSGLSTERGTANRIRSATDVRRAGRGSHHHIVNLPSPPAPRPRERDISHSQRTPHLLQHLLHRDEAS